MNRFQKGLWVAIVGLGLSASAGANDNIWAGVKASTLGLGAEAIWSPLPWFDVRGGFNIFNYDEDGSQAGINYDATLELRSLHATGNFKLPLSPLRLSAGIYINDNSLQLASEESNTYNIGDRTYTSAEVGTLRSNSSFNRISPYIGIGYDRQLVGRVGLNLDLGVLLQGDPSVSLTADGQLRDDPSFLASLEQERSELADELDKLKFYPVASLAFTFNFL